MLIQNRCLNSAEIDLHLAAVSAHLPYVQLGWSELRERLLSGGSFEEAIELMNPSELKLYLMERRRIWSLACETIELCRQHGIKITYPSAEDYPLAFQQLPQPPLFVSYIGEPVWLTKSGISIVGSRDPLQSTLGWMEENVQLMLRKLDIFVASGGARGIDQAAHRVAIRANRPTLAFLPCGLLDTYPKEFRNWYEAIKAGGGAIISEYPPNERMYRGHFQRRNRMIAAVGSHLFVAQAGRKSGTLITARQALELGRPIAVLPSSPVDPRCLGGLDLLYDGAQLVRDRGDLELFFTN